MFKKLFIYSLLYLGLTYSPAEGPMTHCHIFAGLVESGHNLIAGVKYMSRYTSHPNFILPAIRRPYSPEIRLANAEAGFTWALSTIPSPVEPIHISELIDALKSRYGRGFPSINVLEAFRSPEAQSHRLAWRFCYNFFDQSTLDLVFNLCQLSDCFEVSGQKTYLSNVGCAFEPLNNILTHCRDSSGSKRWGRVENETRKLEEAGTLLSLMLNKASFYDGRSGGLKVPEAFARAVNLATLESFATFFGTANNWYDPVSGKNKFYLKRDKKLHHFTCFLEQLVKSDLLSVDEIVNILIEKSEFMQILYVYNQNVEGLLEGEREKQWKKAFDFDQMRGKAWMECEMGVRPIQRGFNSITLANRSVGGGFNAKYS